MLPADSEAVRQCLLRWAGGDGHAAAFLGQIAEIARLADDIVDDGKDRQRNVCWLLSRCLTVLPLNPFFAAHASSLAPLINTVIVQWQQSDAFRVSGEPLKQAHGFVMREAVGQIVTAVASIVGGYAFARAVAEDFFETCHAGSTETVASWIGE